MNRDSEHIQKRILMLLQDLFPTASLKDVEAASQALGYESLEPSTQSATNSVDQRSLDSSMSQASESSRSFHKESVFELGDVPAVQDRFHALLKNRLQSEIQRNPPLFPWESELQDYETNAAQEPVEPVRSGGATPVGEPYPVGVWLRQLGTLNLPVRMPDLVLTTLLQKCQEVMQTPLREGAKLVRAVEELFPGQDQALNYLAGLVIASPARSGSTIMRSSTEGHFPPSYESAVPAQQMVLSLLAAQEIINNLTLTVSAQQPVTERQWETDAGSLSLQVTYQKQQATPSASIRAVLPCGGTLQVRDGDAQTITRRSQPGYLSGELFNPEPGQLYPIEVSLETPNSSPLIFTIRIV